MRQSLYLSYWIIWFMNMDLSNKKQKKKQQFYPPNANTFSINFNNMILMSFVLFVLCWFPFHSFVTYLPFFSTSAFAREKPSTLILYAVVQKEREREKNENTSVRIEYQDGY